MRLARILASTPQPASRQSIAEIRAPTVRDSPHEGYPPRGDGLRNCGISSGGLRTELWFGASFRRRSERLVASSTVSRDSLFPSGRPVGAASRIRCRNAPSVHPSSNIRFQFSPIWSSRNALRCRSSCGSAPLILAGALDHTH